MCEHQTSAKDCLGAHCPCLCTSCMLSDWCDDEGCSNESHHVSGPTPDPNDYLP